MKRRLFIVFFFFCALLLQAAFPHLPFAVCRLEFPLLVVFYLCFTATLFEGSVFLLLIGSILEVWSLPGSGLLTLSYLIVFMTVKILEDRLFLEGWMRALWVIPLTLYQKGLSLLLFPAGASFGSFHSLFFQAILHGLAFFGILVLDSRRGRLFPRRRVDA
ncbi:MAG: hypothetical protein HYY44_02560 [Deltaproteobacteria bacterium]|nr:hypothetical protein [Deltaproteobacteria bacterium]MBI4373489.1 hypothetical protein [Deltaproteobacteria bacterium]